MLDRVRFQFSEGAVKESEIEDDLGFAIFAAECIHGRPQTRMEVRYVIAADDDCTVEVSGPAGEDALRIFIGLLDARFEDRRLFSIERRAHSRDHPITSMDPK